MQPTNQGKRLAITGVVVIVIIALIVVGVYANADSSSPNATATPLATTTPSPSNAVNNQSTQTYADGSYTASGSYRSPGGTETISITVTLRDDTITSTSAKSQASGREAREYQNMFINGYSQTVVGKKVDEVQLSRVSGSSLTSQGFNDALDQIKNQAKG